MYGISEAIYLLSAIAVGGGMYTIHRLRGISRSEQAGRQLRRLANSTAARAYIDLGQ